MGLVGALSVTGGVGLDNGAVVTGGDAVMVGAGAGAAVVVTATATC